MRLSWWLLWLVLVVVPAFLAIEVTEAGHSVWGQLLVWIGVVLSYGFGGFYGVRLAISVALRRREREREALRNLVEEFDDVDRSGYVGWGTYAANRLRTVLDEMEAKES